MSKSKTFICEYKKTQMDVALWCYKWMNGNRYLWLGWGTELIICCSHVLDFSVIDRTPPPLFGVADGEMGRSSDKRGAPVTPFTLVWGQISWADFQCSFFGTWILLTFTQSPLSASYEDTFPRQISNALFLGHEFCSFTFFSLSPLSPSYEDKFPAQSRSPAPSSKSPNIYFCLVSKCK